MGGPPRAIRDGMPPEAAVPGCLLRVVEGLRIPEHMRIIGHGAALLSWTQKEARGDLAALGPRPDENLVSPGVTPDEGANPGRQGDGTARRARVSQRLRRPRGEGRDEGVYPGASSPGIGLP